MNALHQARSTQTLTRILIQSGHMLSCYPSWRRFESACQEPAATQGAKLKSYIQANRFTDFGIQHHFESIDAWQAFQSKVPIRSYAEHEPWIQRAAAGSPRQLTQSGIVAFEPTSGSSSPRKLIPYTKAFLQEVQAAVDPWLYDLRQSQPAILARSSYWSVSSASLQEQASTESGIPIGLQDDTEYFGPIAQWALRKTLSVDPRLSQIQDHESWRRATSLALLEDHALGFISVWHPSFLTLIIDDIENNYLELVQQLSTRRRKELQRRAPVFCPKKVWPRLQLISCWSDGPARGPAAQLRQRFPGTALQGKGLMATEGTLTIPLSKACAPVLAVNSHFFEFQDLETPKARPRLGHELRSGASYQPIITTAGGLYRYALGDVLRCVGHWRNAPCLHFEGRCDQRVDLTGEKLNMHFVQQALQKAERSVGVKTRFMALSAQAGSPAEYLLCVDLAPEHAHQLAALAKETESQLCSAHHYQVSRRNGQLRPVKALRVPHAAQRYLSYLSSSKQKLGDIKPTCLIPDTAWLGHQASPTPRGIAHG